MKQAHAMESKRGSRANGERMASRGRIIIDDGAVLDPLELSDIDAIWNTIDSQREHLGRWLPFVEMTTERAFTEFYVTTAVEGAARNLEPQFAIRVDGVFAGLVGFRGTDRFNRRTEIGYWISKEFEGRGLMTRAVIALVNLAFSDLGMNRVQIRCATGNDRSRRIPIRLGFRLEGVERDGELLSGGQFTDLEVYALLARDWRPLT